MNEKRKIGKFNIRKLIELVEAKPCIWDRFNNDYKIKDVREAAWDEIIDHFQYTCTDFENMERKDINTYVVQRWRNLRDNFTRSLRNTDCKTKYSYFNELLFLVPNIHGGKYINMELKNDLTSDDYSNEMEDVSFQSQDGQEPRDSESPTNGETSANINFNSRKRKATSSKFEFVNANTFLREEFDEDEAFLKSILPTIRKFSEDEKLDFRMGVMCCIQNVKYKRKCNALTLPSD